MEKETENHSSNTFEVYTQVARIFMQAAMYAYGDPKKLLDLLKSELHLADNELAQYLEVMGARLRVAPDLVASEVCRVAELQRSALPNHKRDLLEYVAQIATQSGGPEEMLRKLSAADDVEECRLAAEVQVAELATYFDIEATGCDEAAAKVYEVMRERAKALENVPLEVKAHIASYLNPRDLAAMSMVSADFHNAVEYLRRNRNVETSCAACKDGLTKAGVGKDECFICGEPVGDGYVPRNQVCGHVLHHACQKDTSEGRHLANLLADAMKDVDKRN
jgi:hypothetical protein